jgi:hypothetical protein
MVTVIRHDEAGRRWVDRWALLGALGGAILAASVAIWVVKRRWWMAGGFFALDSALLLDTVTHNARSVREFNMVLAAMMILSACFVITLVADARSRRRARLESAQ